MSTNAKLRITDLVWNAANQPKPGTPVTFTVTLKNDGPEPLEAFQQQTTIIIYVDRDEQTRWKYDGGLEPGESITFDSHVWEAVAGNHVITAELNFIRPTVANWNTGVNFVKNLRVAEEALPVPPVAAEAGMNTLTFSDDFTTMDTIDLYNTGRIGYKWYVSTPFEGPNMTPDGVELTKEGVKIAVEPGMSALRMNDVDSGAGWGFTHGFMECRFRMPAVRLDPNAKGAPPSIWSNPVECQWATNTDWVEMDWMEYWGDIYSDMIYTVTMHHQKRVYPSDPDHNYIKYWVKNDVKVSHHIGLNDGDWHTMGWLWEEGRLTTYVDGEEVMTQRWSKDGEPVPKANLVKGESQVGAFSKVDEQIMPVLLFGVKSWPLEVDYLNVWQVK